MDQSLDVEGTNKLSWSRLVLHKQPLFVEQNQPGLVQKFRSKISMSIRTMTNIIPTLGEMAAHPIFQTPKGLPVVGQNPVPLVYIKIICT